MWFTRRRHHHSDPDAYVDALAAWQVDHDADYRDLTPAQQERMRLHSRCVDVGLDPSRVTYAQMLVQTGRIGEGQRDDR